MQKTLPKSDLSKPRKFWGLAYPFGRPRTGDKKIAEAQALLAQGTGILKVAKIVGLGSGTVQNIRHEMAGRAGR
jgi:hypothetical protein